MLIGSENDLIEGAVNDTLRRAICPTGASGTLQCLAETGEWVPVENGALVGPQEFTFYVVTGDVMRFASVVGQITVRG